MNAAPSPLVVQVLDALRAVAGEGVAVVALHAGSPLVVCAVGSGSAEVLSSARASLHSAARSVQRGLSGAGRPVMAAPIDTADGVVRVIALWRGPRGSRWKSQDELLATAAAAMLRPLLDHADKAAAFDALTGLPSRTWFQTELVRCMERMELDHAVGTLMLIDIDQLRYLNELAGQAEGDRVLLQAASGLRKVTRPTDVLGRVGDDEFSLWLNGMDHLAAAERADQIHRTLLAPPRDGVRWPTLSIAIATRWHGSPETAEGVFCRVEAAMLRVKADGGNAWLLAPEQPG